jgi:hypothetical protein
LDRGKSDRIDNMNAANWRRNLAGAEPGNERGRGFRAVGVAVSRLGAPILSKRGCGLLVRLKTNWPAIVGADWAAVTWPASLTRDGGLKLRTTPSAALEMQHRAPLLIERVNGFFGHPAVTRLILVQGPLPLSMAPSRPSPLVPAADEAAALDERLSDIADPELRSALARLGRAVLGTRR